MPKNAKEYFSSEVNSYMENQGIIHESSCVNIPQQNGLAERKIGHIMASARSLLFQGNCPKSYWGEVVATAVHLINSMPSRTLSLQSPIDLLSSSYPHLSLRTNLVAKVFGCIAYIHSHHAGKLDPRAVKCIFVGYFSTQKGYICYHPSTKRRFITADTNFDEYNLFYEEDHRSEEYVVTNEETTGTPNLIDDSLDESPMTTDQENEENQELEKESILIQEGEEHQTATNQGWSIAVSKGIRECRKKDLYPVCNYMSYDRISSRYKKIVQALLSTSTPRNVQEAMSQTEWKKAMDEEMHALLKYDTWEMGPLPEGKKLIGSRWVYAIKHNSDSFNR